MGWDLLDPKSQPNHLEEDSPTDKAKGPQVSSQNSDSQASSENSGREVEVVTDDEVLSLVDGLLPFQGTFAPVRHGEPHEAVPDPGSRRLPKKPGGPV